MWRFLSNLSLQDDMMQYTEMEGPGAVVWVVYAAVIVFILAAWWKVFQKAGKPGWAAIIPIYNYIVLLDIAGKPMWWIILLLIPFVNIIILFMMFHGVSKAFGKGFGFTLGLIFLGFIFFPILAWSDAQYTRPAPAM